MTYEQRVRALEAEGLTTSDAQGAIEAEDRKAGAGLQARFKIGQQYMGRGSQPKLHTVTDIYKTYNSNGELVKIRYAASCNFMGQTLVNHDVVDTTIAMGKL